jgi:endonuclease/exonuclease/phosphatase family metal-dependent hydrolase
MHPSRTGSAASAGDCATSGTSTTGGCDPTALRAAAREVDADVLALQEVDWGQPRSGRQDQTALVADAVGAAWSRFVPTLHGTPGVRGWTPAAGDSDQGARSDRDGPAYGIAVVSRLPLLRWRVHRFAAAPARMPLLMPGPGGVRVALVRDEPRAVVAAVLDSAHGPLTVVATHLSFVPGFNVAALRSIVRWAADLPRPLFLAGDLNLPGSVPSRITGWTPMVRTRSYPSFGPRVQLDHVLADGLPAHTGTTSRVWALPVSDHRAVGVDVDL